MHRSERDKLEKELKRFGLAESDMLQVVAGADFLLQHDVGFELGRILETGIVATYARPFTDNNWIRAVDRVEWAPPDAAGSELHDKLLRRRDKVYAHTDRTELRQVHGPHTIIIEGGGERTVMNGQWLEQYTPFKPHELEDIGRLAEAQAQRFRDEWLGRRDRLGAAG